MRSEERAGAISFVMLFLWGTLIAEPFHIFARYIAVGVTYALRGLGANSLITSLALYLIVVSVIILLQKLSKSKLGVFIPCTISVLFIAMLIIRSIVNSSVGVSDAVCLAIPALLSVILYVTKFEKGLKWFSDCYTYSLAVALLNSLIFVPLSNLNNVLSRILYITRYNDLDITGSFKDLAGIPELVWGLFLFAFAVLPIAYLVVTGRRK